MPLLCWWKAQAGSGNQKAGAEMGTMVPTGPALSVCRDPQQDDAGYTDNEDTCQSIGAEKRHARVVGSGNK